MSEGTRIILPLDRLQTNLLPIHMHFLKSFEIHLHGVIREVIRLMLTYETRLPKEQLELHIQTGVMLKAWENYQYDVNPRYGQEEAIDIYRRIVTMAYEAFYPYLHLAISPMYRRLNVCDIKLTHIRYLCDAIDFVLTFDWLPF